MVNDRVARSSVTVDQLKKYARDFAQLYESVREKKKHSEAADKQLIRYAHDMNKIISKLKGAHEEVQDAFLDTIQRLLLAAEYKDEETGRHIKRISHYSALLAEKLGLPAKDVQNIFYAASMHDLGKIGIPDSILLKPGKLTDEEFAIMKTHPIIGAKILAFSKAEVIQMAEQIAISHHEKWNGRGYPYGLSKENIPLVGRIVGLADVFDALTSKRPYKEPYPLEAAVEIISKERGESFDPDIGDVFLDCVDKIVAIKEAVDETQVVRGADFTYSERDLVQQVYA